MKTNLRNKIRDFVQSEEGQVGVKSPLTLGIATGSIFVAQAIVGTTPAMACLGDTDCGVGEVCADMKRHCVDQGPGWPPHCWWEGECRKDH